MNAETVYAVGDSGTMYIYDGVMWAPFPEAPPLTVTLRAVTAFSSSDIWIGQANPSQVSHWDGNAWSTPETLGSRVFSLWAHDSSNVFAAGRRTSTAGNIWHWNGSSWQDQDLGVGDLHSLHGSGLNNIWLVGDVASGNARVFRSTDAGSNWNPVSGFADINWRAVYALSDQSVWLAGSNGTVAFWDGTSITTHDTGVTTLLQGIYALDNENVWAVGVGGVMRYFDGTDWFGIDLPGLGNNDLAAITALPDGRIWAVGQAGRIYFSIPEPTSALLLSLGLLPLLLNRRRG